MKVKTVHKPKPNEYTLYAKTERKESIGMNSLKHASRRELLMVLAEMGEENENLTRRLRETEKKLEEKEIKISECGTLAEAALKLNGIFEACDRAAQEYLDNVRIMYPMKEENESAETEEEIRDSKKDA